MSNEKPKTLEYRPITTTVRNPKTEKEFSYTLGTAFFLEDGSIDLRLHGLPVTGRAHINSAKTDTTA